MMIWLLTVLPLLVGGLFYLWKRNFDVLKVTAIAFVVCAIVSFSMQAIMREGNMSDTEWWGNYGVSVNYYEQWDEWIEQTCHRDVPCGTDTSGNTIYCDEEYDCSYCETHDAYWTYILDNGSEHNIDQSTYNYYKNLWGGTERFIELNRDYYTEDGDQYSCAWDADPLHSINYVTQHTYENRVQATNSIFKPENITPEEAKQWGLYEYPECIDGQQDVVLGYAIDAQTQKLFEYINGYYGSHKEFKLYILVFHDQSAMVAEKQRAYWQAFNKNEFVVCMSLSKTGELQWVQSYSWMDKPILSTKVNQFFLDSNKVDFNHFAKWLPANINECWDRKHFRDFNYLQVEITSTQYKVISWTVGILTVIFAIVLLRLFCLDEGHEFFSIVRFIRRY